MKKLTLAFLAVTALAMLGSTTSTAQAQGLHIRSGGLHLDIGRPHAYHRTYHRSSRYYAPAIVRVAPRTVPHYDYYPSRVVPHGDHLDVIPGHTQLHFGGHHYDRHIYRGSRGPQRIYRNGYYRF